MTQFEKVLDDNLDKIEAGVKATAKNASVGCTLAIRQRKDGDYDLVVSGRCNVPYNGDVRKARLEGNQLVMF